MAEIDGKHPEDETQQGIDSEKHELALPYKHQVLRDERRKCSEAAAEADDQKQPHLTVQQVILLEIAEKKPNQETTEEIDHESTERKRGRSMLLHKERNEEAQHASGETAGTHK